MLEVLIVLLLLGDRLIGGATPREVASCGPDVGVEERVSAEHIVGPYTVPDVVRRVARQVQDRGAQGADGEDFIVFKGVVERVREFLFRHAVGSDNVLLDLSDSLADTYGGRGLLGRAESSLQVVCRAEVIGVDVSLEYLLNGVSLDGNQGEDAVGGAGCDCGAGWIKVENCVYEDSRKGLAVCDNILPGACNSFIDIMNDWFGSHDDSTLNVMAMLKVDVPVCGRLAYI
ncbi:hypothetical protein HYQ46_003128 [Verticillium longisporum]|nr:hypothetical protein HYQ46_003128 [Verticillium longisporum]